jgi:heavy metal sensor kinase
MTLSIRARLTAVYLTVLTTATMLLAGGAWWLFRDSVDRAADATLSARVEGTRRFIVTTQHELPPEEVSDEFKEFGDMTHGEALIEVTEADGRVLLVPALPGWAGLRVPPSAAGALRVEARELAGEPFRAAATELVLGGHRYRLFAATSMATAYTALRRFTWLLMGLVPAVLMLAAAGGFWISGRALAPVDRITSDVKSISVRNLDRRLEVPAADDELRRLTMTFNEMLARLQAAVVDMARFTGDASHELRTPVSVTRTTVEVALAKERPAAEYREALTDVAAQMERMSALVNDLLVLARSDAGVEPHPAAPVNLNSLITDTVHELDPAFRWKGVSLSTGAVSPGAVVNGNVESLHRLLVILLDNAMKYTPAGGTVSVDVSVDAAKTLSRPTVVIDLVDSGAGLGDVDHDRAFDRFYRGAAARQAAPEGSGLGLSIARAIVERHAGTISLSSSHNGTGCRARVILPLANT